MMPILSFTTEEIWSYIREEDEPLSVQLLDLPQISTTYHDEALAAKWERLIAIRENVTKAAEEARRDKVIGHSLDAAVTITAGKDDFALLQSVAEELADICIVSEAMIRESADSEIKVEVTAAKGEKCNRCWKYRDDLDTNGLCLRCADVIKDMDLSEIAGK